MDDPKPDKAISELSEEELVKLVEQWFITAAISHSKDAALRLQDGIFPLCAFAVSIYTDGSCVVNNSPSTTPDAILILVRNLRTIFKVMTEESQPSEELEDAEPPVSPERSKLH